MPGAIPSDSHGAEEQPQLHNFKLALFGLSLAHFYSAVMRVALKQHPMLQYGNPLYPIFGS